MKKKIIIISVCSALVVILAIAAVLFFALRKNYLEKIDYDHVAPTSYNGVSIVGEDGLLYLVKNGKKISDGYVFLQSVNDYYKDIEAAATKKESDLILFDYYIAHHADSATYCLLTPDGEEYTIVGDNYSIESISLPYIVFVNNTTSRKAAISLLKINSDLSYKSGNDITLKPFSTIETINNKDTVLCKQLFATDEAADKRYSLFCDDGTLIVSSEHLERLTFLDSENKETIYCLDLDENAIYSARGELLSKGIEPMNKVSELFGTLLRYDSELETSFLDVFSATAMFSLSDAEYDLAAARFYKGAVVLPVRNGGFEAISVIDGQKTYCADIVMLDTGALLATVSAEEYVYLTDCAEPLISSPYSDLTLLPELCVGKSFVFSSETYRTQSGNANAYYFARAGHSSVEMNFEENETLSLMLVNDGAEALEGAFILGKLDGEQMLYRICTPFAPNPISDTFDAIDVYLQADIYWARCVSYDRGCYDIIDPVSNQKAGSIACEKEDFVKLSFAFEAHDVMLTDAYDEESGISVLVISVSRYEDNEGTTSSVRYYAVYRSAFSSSKNFNSGTLKMSEIGMNLLRSDPFNFFPLDNCLVLNGIGASRVLRFNDSSILSEVASMPYRVTDIIYDSADQNLIYYLVESEGGNKGLYDKDGNCILAPYYNDIYSLENGRFVVKLRGGVGVLEYRNFKLKQLIDYSYCSIEAFSDGGYLAVDGNGNGVLYERDKIIVKKPIQSVDVIVAYSMSDDGTFNVQKNEIFSVGGDLYMHESSIINKPKCASFEKPETNYENIANKRARSIKYYDLDGKVTASDVVYPTEYYFNSYAMQIPVTEDGWFFSEELEEQLVPVVKEEFFTYPDFFISLYPKVSE